MTVWLKGNPDLLFAEDGSVRLPLLTGLAVNAAKREPHRCLSRQPTQDRAEAVMEAVRGRCAAKGLGLEIRPSKTRQTFGLYVVPLRP